MSAFDHLEHTCHACGDFIAADDLTTWPDPDAGRVWFVHSSCRLLIPLTQPANHANIIPSTPPSTEGAPTA